MRKLLLISMSTVALAALPLTNAQAEVDYGVHVYMSAPKVQGTPLTSNFTTETFDSLALGPIPADLSIGKVTGAGRVDNGGVYGGASSTSGSPFTGGVSSKYATTVDNSTPITIDLTKPAKYLGLWWSAGSPSNQVKFFSDGQEVASMTTAALMTKLSTPSVTALDGTTNYTSTNYFGNPVNGGASGEPFVYLNLYAVGGTNFDRLELTGGGFEFDNITVSDLENEPTQSLVDVQFIPGLIEPTDPTDPTDPTGPTDPTDTTDEEVLADTGYDAFAMTFGAVALILAGAGSVVLARSRRKLQ